MKKYFAFTVFIFFACDNSSTAVNQNAGKNPSENKIAVQQQDSTLNTDSMQQTDSARIIGGNKDEHGCIASAGYRWSEAKNDCVRLFEIGIRLQPVEKNNDMFDGFLIFNDEKTKAELFIADEKKPVLLTRSGSEENYVWKKDSFELFAWKGYVVKKDGKAIYHAPQ